MYSRPLQGFDDVGNVYQNIDEMWTKEFDPTSQHGLKLQVGSKSNWYHKGAQYWDNEEASINGNLGGFEILHSPDIQYSRKQLEKLLKENIISDERALDCGSGIGRITQHLLIEFFKKVDLIDQCEKYIQQAKTNMHQIDKVENYYAQGLQDFKPKHKYSVVWIQWVIGQLTDDDLVEFLVNCKLNLLEKGVIIVKDNVTRSGFVVSKDDYSVCRSEGLLATIFQKAGLKVLFQDHQQDFPKELYKVNFYVLSRKKE